jgi:AcrR family transcriptional regulator
MPTTTAPATRRRQARGVRRAAQLLDAAAVVFAEVGYESATTNAIAARAGASPGTLYQFFANKEALAQGLAERYLEQMNAIFGFVHAPAACDLPLDVVLDRTVDPLIAFNDANPGFKALFGGPAAPEQLLTSALRLHEAVLDHMDALIACRDPLLTTTQRRHRAVVAIQIIKGMLPTIQLTSGDEREALTVELKRALSSYLGSLGSAG